MILVVINLVKDKDLKLANIIQALMERKSPIEPTLSARSKFSDS